MAPSKHMKTYSRGIRSANNSLDIFTGLILKKSTNKFKRNTKKKKIEIKELPPRSENLLENDSLQVSLENTFDKLLKGANFNNVKIKNNVSKIDSSENNSSILKPVLVEISNTCHSPAIKRNKKDALKTSSQEGYSPILTRSKSKSISSSQVIYTLPETKSDVTQSLSVEVVREECNNFPSLSYIKLSHVKNKEIPTIQNTNDDNSSLSKIFTNSIREKITVHSSTPARPEKHKTVICDAISPIKRNDMVKENPAADILVDNDISKIVPDLEKSACNINSIENTKSISDQKIKKLLQDSEKHSDTRKSFITLRKRKVFKNYSSSFTKKKTPSKIPSFSEVDFAVTMNSKNISENNLSPANYVTQRRRSKTPSTGLSKDITFSKELVVSLTNLKIPNKFSENNISIEKSLKEGRELVINITKLNSILEYHTNVSDPNSTNLEEHNSTNNNTANYPNDSNVYFSKNSDVFMEKKLVVKLPKIKSEKPEESLLINDTLGDNTRHDISIQNVIPKSEKSGNITHNLSDIIESSVTDEALFKIPNVIKRRPSKTLVIKPGKSYRRSLSMYKKCSLVRSTLLAVRRPCQVLNDSICRCSKCSLLSLSAKLSMKIVPILPNSPLVIRETSILEDYAHSRQSIEAGYEPSEIGRRESSVQSLSKPEQGAPAQESVIYESRKSQVYEEKGGENDFQGTVTAREVVLRRCGQTEPLPFKQCYPDSCLEHCQKIGEGVYGEVFLFRDPSTPGGTTVMKVIPIEGDLMVNGERQKRFEEILSEIVIATELKVKKIRCTYGAYPDRLLELWELYDETRGSENDSPEIFPDDQLYIVLELANGGTDLEAAVLTNALQAYCVFKQVACALAVAENCVHFEHRDLHWGNVLLTNVDKKKTVTFKLNGRDIEIKTEGVEVSIIDFTLSRIECDGVVMYNDLGQDEELFTAEGDYQFEVYRLMRDCNGNDWQSFRPYTNLLWLHYVLDKATTALRYRSKNGKLHKDYVAHLAELKDDVLSFASAKEFVEAYF